MKTQMKQKPAILHTFTLINIEKKEVRKKLLLAGLMLNLHFHQNVKRLTLIRR